MTAILFHAIDPRDRLFSNNILLNAGRITSMLTIRSATPCGEGLLSPYEAFSIEREKEDVFETIRAREFQNAPPRKGALFLFSTPQDATAANAKWWHGQRVILPANILNASRVGAFDSTQLDAPRDQWESAARAYWSGAMTTHPQIEILLDGTVQLQGWEPYGKLLGPDAFGIPSPS